MRLVLTRDWTEATVLELKVIEQESRRQALDWARHECTMSMSKNSLGNTWVVLGIIYDGEKL